MDIIFILYLSRKTERKSNDFSTFENETLWLGFVSYKLSKVQALQVLWGAREEKGDIILMILLPERGIY